MIDRLRNSYVPAAFSGVPAEAYVGGISADYMDFNERLTTYLPIISTSSLITGAALIMVAVISGFASGDMVVNQQAGFGLAVAVLLDATLVRSILVPASMQMLGSRNWYLPSWLSWLPDLRVEPQNEVCRAKMGFGAR